MTKWNELTDEDKARLREVAAEQKTDEEVREAEAELAIWTKKIWKELPLSYRRLRLSVALVVLVLLGGCSSAEAPETATTPETAATVDMELESLRQRAEEGDADAQYNLGFVYETGLGVPQDDEEAVIWFLRAADQGHAEAQASLGFLYSTGDSVPQNYVEAVRWYRLAADRGFKGEGVLQNYVEAHKWFNLVASRATGDEQKISEEARDLAKARDLVAQLMTPAQLAEAQKLAREWQAAFDARQE